MRPVLFEIFGIKIYGYGTMIAIGIVAALILLDYRAKKRGYDGDSIFNMSMLAIASGVIGGKVFYYITEIKSIINDPSLLKDFGQGFVVYGSIIGGALGVYYYCRKKDFRILSIFDLAIPSLPLAQGFGRIGCLLAGCCYGSDTCLPIGITFKNSPYAPAFTPLFPTQILSSIFDFLLALFLLWIDKKKLKEGRLFSLYLIIYSIGRFIIEFFRGDPRGNVSVLSTSQFISIFTLIFGLLLFTGFFKKRSK